MYTSLYAPSGNPVVQVVTVVSSFYSSDSTTSYMASAEAYITHLSAEAMNMD